MKDDLTPLMLGLTVSVTIQDVDMVLRVLTFVVVAIPTGLYYLSMWRKK